MSQTTPRKIITSLGERYLLVGLWLVMVIVFVAIDPARFLQLPVLLSVFSLSDIYVFLGLATIVTLYVGEIDLSVAFVMGLSATIVPVLYASGTGLPIGVCVLIALAASVLAGVVNAILVVKLGVPAIIVTLGFGTVLLGVALAISGEMPQAGLPREFAAVATTRIFGLTSTFWYGLALALVLAYVLYLTPLGRRMTFVGANREVSRLAGVNVTRIRFGAYVVGALIAGIGGVLLVARLGGFDPSSSSGYLLPAFATAFVSASVVSLGRFNPVGVLIGAYVISTGTLGLQLLGARGWSQQVFYGLALVLAVTLVTVVRRRSAR